MSKSVVLAIAGIFFGWLIVRLFTKDFDAQYLIFTLFGFLVGYLVKKDEKEE